MMRPEEIHHEDIHHTAEPRCEAIGYEARRRRRRWPRWAAAICLVLLAAGAVRWGRVAWNALRYEYRWHAVMTLSPPPEKIIYEEDPVGAAALLHTRGYVVMPNVLFDRGWYPHPPPGWQAPACFMPEEFAAVDRPMRAAAAFVHGRTTLKGQTSLVVVDCAAMSFGPKGHVAGLLGWTIERESSPGRTVRHVGDSSGVSTVLLCLRSPSQHLRVFAGQPDPADPSHFTICYETAGARGIIDGWLRDPIKQGPALGAAWKYPWPELKIRDGPAAPGGPNFFTAEDWLP